jgi:hypothetical protein
MAVVPLFFDYYHTSPLGGQLGIFKTIKNIHDNFIWKATMGEVPATGALWPE